LLYMHGSGGLVWANPRFARTAAGCGYVVICPDELAGSKFRSRKTHPLHTLQDDTGYWQNSLFYEGKQAVAGESLEFCTQVNEVIGHKEHYRTLYNKVYHVRRAELHFVLSRLPPLAHQLGVVIMGCSEGAMTVARFDDQRYGRMIVGRVLAAYSAEFCYMHSSQEEALLGGQKNVPTLNLIGTHDEYFGPPPHGNFKGSAAALISAKTGNWGEQEITGNAYRSFIAQGFETGLVATFPGGEHDLTLHHNHEVRDVLLDFLHRPERCADLLEHWEFDAHLMSHVSRVRRCSPSGGAEDVAGPNQRILWVSFRAAAGIPHTIPYHRYLKLRRLSPQADEEELQAEREFLGVTGEQAHALKKKSEMHGMGSSTGALAAMMFAGADQEAMAEQMEAADPYADVYAMKVEEE